MEGSLEVETGHLPELLKRLKEKRELVEKELSELGTAPAELSELLRLCQGFERAFSTSVSAFLGETGLAGTLRKLPVEKKFRLEVIKAVVREADGYQPHLVSPERGLRRLIDECIQMARDPVQTCVERVYALMVSAAGEASRKALSSLTSMEIADMKSPRMPAFERTVTQAAAAALDDWKKEAMMVATALVEMESDYITSAYFRRAIANRAMVYEEQELPESPIKGSDEEEEEEEDEDDDDDDSTEDDEDDDPKPKRAPSRKVQGDFDPNDLKAGYLEKRIGEGSGRGAIPVESWKWQKRWFIFTDTKAMLYYFKSPDDPPNYRGAINIRECIVEDLDAKGQPRTESRGRGDDASTSLLIRITSKDPNKPIIKKHHSLSLRAPTPSEKNEWLQRLRKASGAGASVSWSPVVVAIMYEFPTGRRPPPPAARPGSAAGRRGRGEDGDDDEELFKYSGMSAKPMLTIAGRDTFNIGIGTALPFNETALTLAPIPPWKYLGFDTDGQDRYEAYLEQLGRDCNEYTRVILDTIQTEVPKSVVHCMVRRAKEQMLAKLYSHITSLQPWEVSTIMEEDHSVVQRRAATTNAIKELENAMLGTEKLMSSAPKKGGSVSLPIKFVDMADMWDVIPRPESVDEGRDMYGDYTPAALRTHSGSLGSRGSGKPSVAVPAPAAPGPASASPKEPSPASSAGDSGGVRPPTPPGGAPGANPSPKPRRRPPPAPPA